MTHVVSLLPCLQHREQDCPRCFPGSAPCANVIVREREEKIATEMGTFVGYQLLGIAIATAFGHPILGLFVGTMVAILQPDDPR